MLQRSALVTRPRIAPHVRLLYAKPLVRRRSLPVDLVEQSRVVGEGVILFVFFYTSLNYLHYRSIRKRFEEEDD